MIERLSRPLGTEVRTLTRMASSGYTVAYHAIAELADGRTAFVKAATEPVKAGFIRDEQRVLGALDGLFVPAVLALDDEDPPFLSLGLCSGEWLAGALPTLRKASETAPIDGDALLHLDVRSDNLCIAERGAVLVDWNHACVGNADLDVAAWLPSLRLEGGPEPEEILPGAPGFAALLAGFFGSRAGLPAPPTAPHVRSFQLAQLRVALPWATRQLDLRPPG